MANLRKEQLCSDQLEGLKHFSTHLTQAAWSATDSFGQLFEQGWAVPFQAQAARRSGSVSVIIRYCCAEAPAPDIINVTLHSPADNQMIAVAFDRWTDDLLSRLLVLCDTAERRGIRTALAELCQSDLKVTVNVDDRYFPLKSAVLSHMYAEFGEDSQEVRGASEGEFL